MLNRKSSVRSFISRNSVITTLAITLILAAAVATNAADFSFWESVKEFFGLAPAPAAEQQLPTTEENSAPVPLLAACTFTSAATGNWDAAGTWSAVGTSCSAYPGQTFPGDTVLVTANHNVTLNVSPANAISSLTIAPATNNVATLTFGTGNRTLIVSGTVTLGNSGNNNRRGSLVMTNPGTLQAAGLALANTGSNSFTPGAGTVVLTATNTLPATIFTTFNNLTINGGTTTSGVGLTVANNLTVNSGATLNPAAFIHTISGGGTLNVDGTLDISNASGEIRSGTTGTSTLTIGANGLIRTIDPNGLGPATSASFSTQAGGAWNFSNVDTVGTVEYAGSSAQPVTDRNYNNLIFSANSTKT